MPGLNWRPLPCQGSALPLRQPPEVETGFEPVYTDLQSVASPLGHSTGWRFSSPQWDWERPYLRADDEIRTRDPHLGKVMLYQLSYVRIALAATPLSGRCVRRVENISPQFCERSNRGRPARSSSVSRARPGRITRVSVRIQESHPLKFHFARAIGAVVARFVHTEEVGGSKPPSPTLVAHWSMTRCSSGA